MPLVSVVIPAYNEEKRIRGAVQTVLAAAKDAGDFELEILIVDDGSTDGTAREIAALEREFPQVRSLRHPVNLGMGQALLDAIAEAKGEKLSLFPGDNGPSVYTMRRVFQNQFKADLVLAYFINTEARSNLRNVISVLFNLVYCLTFGVHVKYLQGLPSFPRERLRKMRLTNRGFSLLAEINVKLLRSGATFLEVDGYQNPENKVSGTLRPATLVSVVSNYLRLVYEVFVRDEELYRHRPRRVLPSLDAPRP